MGFGELDIFAVVILYLIMGKSGKPRILGFNFANLCSCVHVM